MKPRLLLMVALTLSLVTALLFFAACSSNDRPQQSVVAPEFAAVPSGVIVVEGEHANGAMYAMYTPQDWNSDLVVYAHGYAFPFEDPALPDIEPMRDTWLSMGFAVAYSSFSETGYAVKEGINNTKQLRGLFASNFAMPERTYLVGLSMGGLISVRLAERNPGLYAGTLSMCGAIGGSKMTLNYLFGVRTLFDYFYGGVLPGDAMNVPPTLSPVTASNLAVGAMLANPGPAFEMAGVSPVDIQFNNPNELFDAIATAIFFHAAGWADLFDRTHMHSLFDNMDVVYTGSSDDTALNMGVDRFAMTRDAFRYLQQWYEPQGDLDIPVVTLHTSRDPVVHSFSPAHYADAVAAAGRSHMLVQHMVDRYGHCTFSLDERIAAFEEMVMWAETFPPRGVRSK